MKVYTLGQSGHVSPAVADAIDLHTSHRQADVLVAARTKAAALARLAERGMGGYTLSNRQFRVAEGDDVDQLVAVGLVVEGTVLAWKLSSRNTPVARIEPGGAVTVVGSFERGVFAPTAAGVDGPVYRDPMTVDEVIEQLRARNPNVDVDVVAEAFSDALMVVAGDPAKWDGDAVRVQPGAVRELINAVEADLEQRDLRTADTRPGRVPLAVSVITHMCRDNQTRVTQLTEQLANARRERQSLCFMAAEHGPAAVNAVAKVLDVTPGRVHQLKDEFLVAEANSRRAVGGPAETLLCSLCPPGESPGQLKTGAALRVHQLARHGVL